MTQKTTVHSDIAQGDVVTEIATANAETGAFEAPEWIKILPAGKTVTRDGRSFTFDPKKLAARFQKDGIDIPIDLDHGITKGGKPEAVGWIKELDARADGLYGRVDWLQTGRDVLEAKTRRFISPTFTHTKQGSATWLHSVALVSAPALSMPALASASPDELKEAPMNAIAEALGLTADADEAACLTAISTLSTGKVDKAVHDETLAKLEAATGELAALKADTRKRHVDELLEGALKDKKILPAQRDHYASLCATDEGLTQVKALLDATAKGLGASGLDDKDAGSADGGDELDPVQLAAKASAYQAEQTAKGITVDIIDAVNHVKGDGK